MSRPKYKSFVYFLLADNRDVIYNKEGWNTIHMYAYIHMWKEKGGRETHNTPRRGALQD